MVGHGDFRKAAEDFRRARQQVGLQGLLARWRGKSLDLLSFEDVRRQLRSYGQESRGLQEIPLDAIVGSVGRYQDFTRTFLPLLDDNQGRWARVLMAQTSVGLPPISVYQIGEAYFVLDGNHRVSVARQMGSDSIEAYVTEVKTLVPLSPDDEADDIILKAEYADFLARTRLDVNRPDVDLALTSPGKYPLLLEHIEVHRYYMGISQSRDVPYEEAVVHWCDEVYLPTVALIRETGLARGFPKRTTADLYVWLADRRGEIEEQSGWEVSTGEAVAEMADTFGSYRPQGIVRRALESVVSRPAIEGSAANRWRRERLRDLSGDSFFRTLLVPIDGSETGWQALDQSISLAQREGSHIYGLFAVERDSLRESILTRALKSEFKGRCRTADVASTFIIEEGDLEQLIAKRERWADLMVLHPSQAGEDTARPSARLRRLIQRASGLVLLVPDATSSLSRPLLAYGDRPASKEALYFTAYVAGQWESEATVLHVGDDPEAGAEMAASATSYLSELEVKSDFVHRSGNVANAIVSVAEERTCELILIGNPRLSPMQEIFFGKVVKDLILTSPKPLMLCR